MKLLADNWYKAISTWVLIAANGLATIQLYAPELQELLPADWYRYALIAALIGRMIRQERKLPDVAA